MLDVLNRFAHGFVVVPVVLACRKGGVFAVLEEGPVTPAELCDRLSANPGHMQVTLRLLESLGWVDVDRDGRLRPTPAMRGQELFPDDVLPLLHADMDSYLRDGSHGFLRPFIERSKRRWQIDNRMLADYLDSLLIVPILSLLAKRKILDSLPATGFSALPPGVREEVIDLLRNLEWLRADGGRYSLTEIGSFMFERAMNLGLAESYRPMLRAMPRLLFGDAAAVFRCDAKGDETHVNRSLNVIASGFMRDRYFAEVENILVAIFTGEPLAAQPRYVAAMGGGDGIFLKRVYETVRDKTPRGLVLDRRPLTMIAIDYSDGLLTEASQALAEIDHVVVKGDLGDPHRTIRNLGENGIDCDQVLHILSFLEQDLPYEPTDKKKALETRPEARYLGAYANIHGESIFPAEVVQRRVEYLGRWAGLVNEHGLIMLDVHCQDPHVIRRHASESESLWLDAIEGYCRQLRVEADVAVLAAAEVGLFPCRGEFRKYPNGLPWCRATLARYQRRPYTVRMARREDVPALLTLETECWAPNLRITAEEIQRRISMYQPGQLVLEMNGRIVGVVYSQRAASIEVLRECRFATIGDFHDPDGSVVQLIGISVLPAVQQLGLGDQLRDLVLLRSSVQAGISHAAALTRCRNFSGDSVEELERYVEARDEGGHSLDPILRFHVSHGAKIEGVVRNYRPEDFENLGTGTLISYELASIVAPAGSADRVVADSQPISPVSRTELERTLRTLLGPKRQAAFSWDKTMKDIGLDSLDLLDFRALLQRTHQQPLSPTFFFAHPTLSDIHNFLTSSNRPKDAKRERIHLEVIRGEERQEVVKAAAPLAKNRSDVAIIGMAGMFPSCRNVDEYWNLLRDGRDGITEIPPDRWDVERYYSADRDAPGKIVSRDGGFIPDIAEFDASFFGIAPAEARLMDPQQRKLLEVHWEALENAGIDPRDLKESNCGIFVGLYTHDYELLQVAAGGDDDVGAFYATGSSASIAAGRIAYFLGTRGPAIAIDTACSSSLVAVHQAIRSLRSGETRLAIASGVNVLLDPRLSIAFSKAGMLSSRGRCRAFDAGADGYVRSEGCAAIVLKRLEDALRDGDPIVALLRGSAINQDGASNGLTAPSLPAQQALLRAALLDSDLQPSEIDYLEAHGTGTNLGDPVEFAAIQEVFGKDPERREPLWLGSAKTNIGHAEAAAGIAGLIKAVLSLRHRALPRHLHFQRSNPLIDLGALPARLAETTMPWVKQVAPRRAGVSSFGFSGTNAHVIVEEAPELPGSGQVLERSPVILPLSGKGASALRAVMSRYAEWLEANDNLPIAEVCRSAGTGRAHFSHRRAFVGRDHRDIARNIRLALDGGSELGGSERPARIAFMFTGQGSQYVDMARDLATDEPAFREALGECSRILDRELDVSLEDVLYPADDDARLIDNTAYTQPALFAVEYALARMLQHWGIHPAGVIGHSVGEYVAACIAGVFSLEDGLRLIAARGRLMGSLPPGGAMAAVLGPTEPVLRLVSGSAGNLSIAAVNGPTNTVISGAAEAVGKAATELEAAGIKVVPLQVSHAFHSPLMDPIVASFREVLRWVRFSEPALPIASNLTGSFASGDIATADYWVKHLREPVRFADGITALLDDGFNVMLEVGPHPVLAGMGQLVADERDAAQGTLWTATLSREKAASESVAECIAALYENNVDPDWAALHGATKKPAVPLPNYPWQRKHFWFREREAASSRDNQPGVLFEPRWSARSLLDQCSSRRVAATLPDSSTLANSLVSVRDSTPGEFVQSDVSRVLEEECRRLVVAALRKLGWAPAVGEAVSTPTLCAQLGILPKYERLLDRMMRMLVEDAFLTIDGKGYTVVSPLPLDPSQLARLVESYPDCCNELRLLERCSTGLDQVLRGAADPLDLIFPGGDLSEAEAVYTKAPFAKAGNAMVVAAIQAIVAKRAATSPLRVLELGAGTGGTTASILPLLPSDTDYLFTDLSPAFLERARECFNDFPNVRYELFDAEKPPAEQGFAAHQFDIVLASNVLHATEDLERSVKHAQQLLSEGGLLLLVEGIKPARWVDLVFGLTDGWWRFGDTSLRPNYPLLDATQWKALLDRCGFKSATVVGTLNPEAKPSAADLFIQGIVIAQAGPAAVPRIAPALNARTDPCLVLADRSGIGHSLAELARREGGRCQLIDAGATSVQLRRALAAFSDLDPGKSLRVVDLRPVDAGAAESAATPLDEATVLGMNTIDVVRSLAATGLTSLTVVTRQGQCVRDGEVASAIGATAWGLGNVIAAENPKMALRLVDLEAGRSAEEAALELHRELFADASDMRTAFRAGQRFVPHFFPVIGGEEEIACDGAGVYLVVGGMGDLGLHTARWLVGHGARIIALAGRTPFPPESEWGTLAQDPFYGPKIELVRDMLESGTELHFMDVDILDRVAVQSLVQNLRALGPVRGLVQSAAIITDRLVADVSEEEYRQVLEPKIAGTWHLLDALAPDPLEFCFFYSSIGSVVGLPGQASYAAANAFLDALARSGSRSGPRMLSINWCGWRDTGLARTTGGQRAIAELELLGIGSISPGDATALIDRAFRSGRPQATTIPLVSMDAVNLDSLDPLLAELRVRYYKEPEVRTSPGSHRPDAISFAGLEGDELLDAVKRTVVEITAELLDVDRHSIGMEQPLGDMGMDSLLGLEFRKVLQGRCGVVLPATLVWSYPTARLVSERIVELLGGSLPTQAPVRELRTEMVSPAPAPDTAVETLSDDDALRQLMGR